MVRGERKAGFTLVELIATITIIAIISTISIVALGTQQKQTRDSRRASQASVIAEALEKYYDKNGEYPSCSAVTDSATNITKNVLVGIDGSVLVAPNAPAGETNSIECSDITSSSTDDFFAYVGDASANCQTGNACLTWQLKYKDEVSGQIQTISSRRTVDPATSGIPIITASAISFDQINASWSAIPNNLGYTIERATDSAFTQNYTSSTSASTSTSVSSLPMNTTYYFRVRANTAGGNGAWSNTATASTWNLSAPAISTSTVSSTAFAASWSAVSRATGYVAQCSADGTTWGANCQTGTFTNPSYTFTSAAQGFKYFVRVKAVNGSFSSAWSSVSSTVTTIDAPAPYNMNSAYMAWNNVRGSASNAACPAGTSYMYHWYYSINGANNFWVAGGQYQVVDYSAVGWNQTVSLTVATRCETANTVSGWTWATGAATKTLTGPSASAWLADYRTAGWGGSCPDGTTSYGFYWRVHGTGTVGDTGWQGPTYATTWNGTSVTWGDGSIRSFIDCNGPWGTVRSDQGWGVFGSGCVNQPWAAACYW